MLLCAACAALLLDVLRSGVEDVSATMAGAAGFEGEVCEPTILDARLVLCLGWSSDFADRFTRWMMLSSSLELASEDNESEDESGMTGRRREAYVLEESLRGGGEVRALPDAAEETSVASDRGGDEEDDDAEEAEGE